MNLVTGATGIIGSHVVLQLLQSGLPVFASKQKQSNVQKTKKLFSYYTPDYEQLFSKIKWVEMDINDVSSIEDALEGITDVYNCVGLVSFHTRDRKRLYQINEHGTRNLVNACLYKNIKTLCHLSSVAAIHNLDYKLPINEDVFWKNSGKESDYAKSKYYGEQEVWRAMEEGLNAIIVSPGIVLSPGFWEQSSSTIFENCYKGNKFYSVGKAAFVSAQDVAKIMIQLVEKKHYGNRYILIENNYSFKEIFDKIQNFFNKPLPTAKANTFMLKSAWLVDSIISFFVGKTPTLTRAIIQSAESQQLYSNLKIKRTLDFQFKDINHEIKDICSLYLLEKRGNNTSV